MREKKMPTVRKKMIIWLLLTINISTVIGFLFGNLLTFSSSVTEHNASLDHTANTIIKLSKLNLSIEKIIDMTTSPVYPVKVVNRFSEIDKERIKSLHNNEKIGFRKNTLYNAIYVKIDDTILEVAVNPTTNSFITTLSITAIALLFSAFIHILLIFASINKMIHPVKTLINATHEVAKGNFDVRVPAYNKNEIDKLMKNFNTMTSELGKMEMLSSDFISNVSHEFKTPISSICGFASLLQNSGLNEKQQEYADIIASESKRLSKLSSNILKLSKLENQDIITEKNWFSLDEQLRQCLLILEKNWNEKHINLEIILDKVDYYGNKELLGQIWINLIDNAIKYTNHDGEIIITCTKQEDNVIVSIKDSGIGMSEETQKRIFEKFYQGDKTHSSDGNGLGLSMVKRIVDMCNGTIEVDSKLSYGSIFVITLPCENSD